MEIRCINRENCSLTKGKIYKVISTDKDDWYEIHNDRGEQGYYMPSRFEIVKEELSTDNEYIDKIAEIIDKRRKTDPLTQEYNKLLEEAFPIKQFQDAYRLGYITLLAELKNNTYKYFCKDCKEIIDLMVNSVKEDKEMKEFLVKLIK